LKTAKFSSPFYNGEETRISLGDTLKSFLLKRKDGRDFWEALSKG
jgi:hypothetical protein